MNKIKSILLVIAITIFVGCGESGSTTTTKEEVIITNSSPVASAGKDEYVVIDKKVLLDATLSSDADNNSLTYSWIIISKPTNSLAELDNSTLIQPSFTADKDGNYTIELVVNDGTVDSVSDTVTIRTMEIVDPSDFIVPTL